MNSGSVETIFDAPLRYRLSLLGYGTYEEYMSQVVGATSSSQGGVILAAEVKLPPVSVFSYMINPEPDSLQKSTDENGDPSAWVIVLNDENKKSG